jgi:hypothetical protein
MKFDVKTIVKWSSYVVAGAALIALVSSSPFHVGAISLAAGAWFFADRKL